MRVRICLLGQPQVFSGDRAHRFAALPKSLSLLGYLIVHRAAPVSRETLAFTHWPDDTEESALAKLRRHLHDVQKALPPLASGRAWLDIDRDLVQWNAESDAWLDIAAFDELAKTDDGRSEAIDLYRGDLLENVYDDWLFAERERLRTIFLGLLLAQARAFASYRDFAPALAVARKLLVYEPWREDVVRDAMRFRQSSGDRAGALHDYDVFRARVREEMGVDVMPETRALRDSIVRNETSPVDAVPLASEPTVLRFAGREANSDALLAGWLRAARGRGQVTFVTGEAGIGKSRLTQTLVDRAHAQGGRVLLGLASKPERLPYLPILDALEDAAAYLPRDALRVVKSAPPVPTSDPAERARFFEAFVAPLREIARTRPVLLVLEDLHWASDATIALLGYLARRLSRTPIHIVVTYRNEEAGEHHPLATLVSDLIAERRAARLILQPLDLAAIREAIRDLAPGPDRLDELARLLQARTAGNPLFITEIVRNREGLTDFASADAATDFAAHLTRRCEELGDDARTVAELAATAGDWIDGDLVGAATGWRPDRIVDAERVLLDRNLIVEVPDRSGIAYAFSHDLIRTTFYAAIPSERRERRHLLIATILEHRPNAQTSAALIGHHFGLGGAGDRAAPWFLQAAHNARQSFALDEAITFAGQAVDGTTSEQERIVALRLHEELCGLLGKRALQSLDVSALEALARHADDRCDVAVRTIRLARACGDAEAEAGALVRLRAQLPEAAESWRASAELETGTSLHLAGRHVEAVAHFREAERSFRNVADVSGLVASLCGRAEAMTLNGEGASAVRYMLEAQRTAEAADDALLVARSLRSAVTTLLWRQEYGIAQALALQMLEASVRIHDLDGEANACARLATIAARQDDYDAAAEYYDRAARVYHAIGAVHGVAGVAINRGVFLTRTFHFDEAATSMREARSLFEDLQNDRGRAIANLNLGMLAFYREEFAEAKTLALEGLRLAQLLGARVLESNALNNLGAAERELGEPEAAIAHIRAGIALAGSDRPVDGIADHADLALAYLRAGDEVAACAAVAHALEEMAAKPDGLQEPYFIWLTGYRCFRLREPVRARAYLREAERARAATFAQLRDDCARQAFASTRMARELGLELVAVGRVSDDGTS